MINNDILRSVRHMLKISEPKLIEIISLAHGKVTPEEIKTYLKKEDEEGYVECPQNTMSRFLNGLIYFKRGKDESRPPLALDLATNNVVLKKLRVAFELKDTDIMDIMKLAGIYVTKSELTALFRKEGHVNYRECGDQFLRNFLKGLTIKVRGED